MGRLGRYLIPIVAVMLLVGAGLTISAAPGSPIDQEAYLQSVRDSMERIPYRIGRWVGTDAEPQPAAERLLRPNKILQRRYTDPTSGRTVSLLVVHCGDVRDMLGHYPPICYPAHGWTPAGDAERASLPMDETALPATRYTYRRLSGSSEQRLYILNFFIIPDGNRTILANMEELRDASRMTWRRGLGAAQVQLLTSWRPSPEEEAEIAETFLRSIRPAIRAIAQEAADE